MAETTWATVYENARLLFGGQTPGANLEARIILEFEQRPAAVQTIIARLGDRYTQGKIHSPWPIVLRELESEPIRDDIHADDLPERERQLRLAERYIRNAGLYEPDETAILDACFGDHGYLRNWGHDDTLRLHVLELWRSEQPRAKAAETARLERAARQQASREADAEKAAGLVA